VAQVVVMGGRDWPGNSLTLMQRGDCDGQKTGWIYPETGRVAAEFPFQHPDSGRELHMGAQATILWGLPIRRIKT